MTRRYRVEAQRFVRVSDEARGWERVSKHASPCAASAAADAQPVHAQVWNMEGDEPLLVHDNGKWPGETTA